MRKGREGPTTRFYRSAFSCLASLACLFVATAGGTRRTFAASPVRPGVVLSQTNVPGRSLKGSFRVTTWNIDGGRHLDQLKQNIATLQADFYLLQEVDVQTRRTGFVNLAAVFASALDSNFFFGPEFEELGQEARPGDGAFQGQATLTRGPVRRARLLVFRRQTGFWRPRAWLPSDLGILQRRLGGRVALVTESPVQGGLLVIYNLHLESRSYGRIQFQQLDEVLDDAKQYGPDTAIIIGGDLNTKYRPSLAIKHMADAGFRNVFGDHTMRTHLVYGALDWLFFRGPLRAVGPAVDKQTGGSDHYPVSAVFQALQQ